jgi:hypothetical protein
MGVVLWKGLQASGNKEIFAFSDSFFVKKTLNL